MKHLVIIGMVVPEPGSTAAGIRMMQLVEVFREWNYRITLLTSAQPTAFSADISAVQIQLNDSAFDEQIRQLNPDAVLFDRYVSEEQFGWRVAENCPEAVRILDTEDLHFLREARRKAFSEGREATPEDLSNDIFIREIASILRSDLSLIISEFEYHLLISNFKISEKILFYLPFVSEYPDQSFRKFTERKHFISIGNFRHEPNWKTVLELKKIWPSIRYQLPDAEMHIYGAYISDKVFQLHNEKEGFVIKGRAGNVAELFEKYRVLLAPIPFGAGLKGKLWESMMYGLPNVTSSMGAEGMHFENLWNGFIEDHPAQFVDKAVLLYTHEKIWNSAQHNGFQILENKFRKLYFVPLFRAFLDDIFQKLRQHRTENYLGRLLSHQSMNATKYMSRWIEEKNRRK